MSRKKVAISQRVDVLKDRDETRDAIDYRLPKLIETAGFLPLLVPNGLSSSGLDQWLDTLRPDAFVLSGGNDIGQMPMRDETERKMLGYAEKNRLPVLGICRGMQMMAVYAGEPLKRLEGHVRSRHELRIALDPKHGELPKTVNSYHDWGIAGVPRGYEAAAFSADNEIEAMRHLTLPWEGWMWHPEREETISPVDLARLQSLLRGR